MDIADDVQYSQWLKAWQDPARSTVRYAGPANAYIVVVGQGSSDWFPFSDDYGTKFAYNCLAHVALDLGWVYASAIEPQHLRTRNGIIVCGTRAGKWLKFYVNGGIDALELTVPQHILTRLSDAEIQTVYSDVRSFVEKHK